MAASVSVGRPASGSLHRFLELELLDNRYPAIHGLRVFGIVSVVQWHVTQILLRDYQLPIDRGWAVTSFGVFFGMDLFFVLSGFLIGSILLRSIDASASTDAAMKARPEGRPGESHAAPPKAGGQIRRFYLRRIFRTFPSYYLVLTYLVLTTALNAAQRHNLIFEYTYLNNYADQSSSLVMPWGWSLGLEEQFYLAVPFLLLLLHKIRRDGPRLALLGGLWLLPLVLRLAIYVRQGPAMSENAFTRLYFQTHTRADTLVAGLILAYVQWRWREPIGRYLAAPFARALVAMPCLFCLWILMQPSLFGDAAVRLVRVFSWGTLTSIMYFGWVLLLLHARGGWIERVLSAPVFRRIASLGYGIYLVHIPVCDRLVSPFSSTLVKSYHWPADAAWTFNLAGTLFGAIVLSYVLHVVVEKPSLKVRDWLAA